MHVQMWLMLPRFDAVVLIHIQSNCSESFRSCLSDFAYQAVYALDLCALNFQNRLAMLPRNDQHGSSLILALVNLCDGVLVIRNECTFTRAGQVVAKTAGRVRGQFELHGGPNCWVERCAR